jgi:hypothetical protein
MSESRSPYYTYMLSSLRLVLRVDVLPADRYNVAHATDGLGKLLDHLGPSRRPALLRDDKHVTGLDPVVVGYRAGDGAGGAEPPSVSVPPAHDGQRQAIAGPGDEPIPLGRCRPRLAGQGDQPEVDRLKPPTPHYSAAP